ncbi:hypothetical protein [Streptomyces sp. NPDC101132]|uniref:hypothetical protein n=1 Tax=Streptomyces sp. NPDC101132 TaxID=3366110 RepID=UPI0037F24103
MTISRNYSLEQAADILGCAPRYLEDNLRKLPHQKIGAAVAFDDDELAEIKDMHRVRPTAAPAQAPVVKALSQIQPVRRSRKTG